MKQNQQTEGVTRLEVVSALPFLGLFLIGLVLEFTTDNKVAVQTFASLSVLFGIATAYVWGHGLIRNIREDYFPTTRS